VRRSLRIDGRGGLAWACSWHTTPGCGRLGTDDADEVEIVDEHRG